MLRRPQESGLALPGHRKKGEQQTRPGEDFSTSHKNQRFKVLSTSPSCLTKWLSPALTHLQSL